MTPRQADGLKEQFDALCQIEDPQRRGYELEDLVASLFRAAHFNVEKNPTGASPRQTDLIATRGPRAYLIEAKWRAKAVDAGDVDSIYSRLDRLPPSARGVLISIAGFGEGAWEVLRAKRSHGVVIPLDRARLEALLSWTSDLPETFERIEEELLVNGSLSTSETQPLRRRAPEELQLAKAGVSFSRADGPLSQLVLARESLTDMTFMRELPDIDWVTGDGYGVSWDLRVGIETQEELFALFGELTEVGWATPDASWSLSQSDAVWHGLGAEAAVAAVSDWKARYDGLERVHHSERLCYADAVPEGFYTLMADIEAHDRRWVSRVSLSFQLSGVPLDVAPYRRLAATLAPGTRTYFRPRHSSSVRSVGFRRDAPPLEVRATMVELDEENAWVVGVVAANPFKEHPELLDGRDGLPPLELREMDLLICEVGSWHPSTEVRDYELIGLEWAQTSDITALKARAEWADWDPPRLVVAPKPSGPR